MEALAGPFFMFALLLVVSGVPKLRDPAATTRALHAIGLPPNLNLGRAVGVVEIATGSAAIVFGGTIAAAALGLLYAGFAGFILVGLRSSQVSSCGCFGTDDTPPSALHLLIDIAAAATGLTLALHPIGDLVSVMGDTPWLGVPLLLLVLVGTWLALLVLTILPALAEETRRLRSA